MPSRKTGKRGRQKRADVACVDMFVELIVDVEEANSDVLGPEEFMDTVTTFSMLGMAFGSAYPEKARDILIQARYPAEFLDLLSEPGLTEQTASYELSGPELARIVGSWVAPIEGLIEESIGAVGPSTLLFRVLKYVFGHAYVAGVRAPEQCEKLCEAYMEYERQQDAADAETEQLIGDLIGAERPTFAGMRQSVRDFMVGYEAEFGSVKPIPARPIRP